MSEKWYYGGVARKMNINTRKIWLKPIDNIPPWGYNADKKGGDTVDDIIKALTVTWLTLQILTKTAELIAKVRKSLMGKH